MMKLVSLVSNDFKNISASLCASFIAEFSETNGLRYVCNQICSHMLEELLQHASAASVLRISSVLGQDLWTVCTDAFASHIVQSTLVLALRMIQVTGIYEIFC